MTDSTTAARQAFLMLRIAFTVAPILFGLDKFANVLTDDWTHYLSSEFNSLLPGDADTAMSIVGVIEIAAGCVVAIAPRYGSVLVPAGSAASSSTCCSSAATATSRCATSA